MKTLTDHLSMYASYHRDRRNIATHFAGIPLIVLSLTTLLSIPTFSVAGLTLTPALVLLAASSVFYLRLSLGFGVVMIALMALLTWAGQTIVQQVPQALALGIGLFVGGWILQFVGHYYEQKKPAFVDDLVGLLVGPLFLVAEVAFALNLAPATKAVVIGQAGPTLIRT